MAVMLKTLTGYDISVENSRDGLDEMLDVEHMEGREIISTRAKKRHTS